MIGLDLNRLERYARDTDGSKAWWGRDVLLAYNKQLTQNDADYMALASPDAVIAMIEELRRLGSDLGRLAEREWSSSEEPS